MDQKQHRVLVFCLSGLGDAVTASPAIAALAARPDRFRLTLLTMFPSVKEYLNDQQFTPDVRLISFLGMSKAAILQHTWPLRRERFDYSVVPYAMNRLGYNVMSLVVGARCRVGFRYQRQRWINAPYLNQLVLDEDPALHAVEENLRWAAHLCGEDAGSLPDDMSYRIQPSAVTAADTFLKQHGIAGANPLIGLHTACNSLKNQHRRCWPAVRFGKLIQQLGVDMPGARFLLFEGPADVEINRAVVAVSESEMGKVIVARMLPMSVVAALIRRCHVFVSNDSGLMHTAAACKVPCVTLFGPTNPTWVRPWRTECTVLSRNLPCSPCFYYSSRSLSCPAHLDFACMRDLPVADVLSAVQKQLARSEAKSVAGS